jgi:hypothetical protein
MPMPAAVIPARDQGGARALRAPITIVTATGVMTLAKGALTIGRLADCDIQLDAEIVSRLHATLRVGTDGVWVEDSHSTNGVFVNGQRVLRAALLREGDRLLIGSAELSVFDESPENRVAPIKQPDTVVPPGEKSEAAHARLPLVGYHRPPKAESPNQIPPTARADVLRVIGAAATRLAQAGNVERAERALASHLDKVLDGAYAGLEVPESMSACASDLALELAGWTRNPKWVDYVVELHLCLRRAPVDDTIARFAQRYTEIPGVDRSLFQYYVDYIRQHQALLTREHVARARRLFELADGPLS